MQLTYIIVTLFVNSYFHHLGWCCSESVQLLLQVHHTQMTQHGSNNIQNKTIEHWHSCPGCHHVQFLMVLLLFHMHTQRCYDGAQWPNLTEKCTRQDSCDWIHILYMISQLLNIADHVGIGGQCSKNCTGASNVLSVVILVQFHIHFDL